MSDSVPISQLSLDNPLKVKFGDSFVDDLLILSIQPVDLFFRNKNSLVKLSDFVMSRKKDYDLGVLLEDRKGLKIMGLIEHKKFRNLKFIPEVGMRYRISGSVERVFRDFNPFNFAYLGCRIEDIES